MDQRLLKVDSHSSRNVRKKYRAAMPQILENKQMTVT